MRIASYLHINLDHEHLLADETILIVGPLMRISPFMALCNSYHLRYVQISCILAQQLPTSRHRHDRNFWRIPEVRVND